MVNEDGVLENAKVTYHQSILNAIFHHFMSPMLRVPETNLRVLANFDHKVSKALQCQKGPTFRLTEQTQG